MEEKRRKNSQKQKDKKRKRMASGVEAVTEMSSNLEESIDTTTEVSTEVNRDSLFQFIRENAETIVHKILTSPAWKEHTRAQEDTVEDSMQALREENQELRGRLRVAEGAIIRCEQTIKRLEDKITDSTTRSMRDNIILKNIPEEQHERDTDVERKVLATVKSELNIPEDEVSKIMVERAHRVGKLTRASSRSRNIVAKLNSKGKSIVMRNLRNQKKESRIRIVEQFPPEVHANREKLWPVFIDAKKQGKLARWNADTLIVDGRTISPLKDNNKDINIDVTDEALKLQVKHTAVTTQQNNHFQAHTVDISSADQVIPAIKALCSDFRVAGAKHVTYAYRLGEQSYSISNWEDDGEWGAGKRIMDSIRNNDSYNILVCVTHWYGSQYMGPARFDIIKELANEAIVQSKFP